MVKPNKYTVIALVTIAGLIVLVAVAILTGPTPQPFTTEKDQETTLTPQQQERVNDRLDECFSTGNC